ncbi:MAG: extracellular solute-binding protein [Sphaerobacter sp.]|nr:extracellular solute-binding protein [Sphaerobacter sp.]
MTPFVEMQALIEAGVIEPWDDYMPQEVKDDLIPSIKEEAMFDGKIYNWPFLLDVVIQGWNKEIVEKAGLDPTKPPANWDEYLANARKVVESGAAPFGCTFDAHGWRSLVPITHSISTDVYTEEGLFDFTSDAAVQALEIMKQMMELANPNVLDPGTSDGGVNDTPDEGAFAAQQVAYYVKYQNAHIRMAATWPDPSQLQLAALPQAEGGAGATVFWNTGAALFTYGQNKELAAEYMKALTYSEDVFKESIAGGTAASGQLPVYTSMWEKWKQNRLEWMADWAFLVGDQLPMSKAIRTTKYGVTQFNLGQPHWEKYLKGEESDPRKAMQAAMDAVMAEVQKSG